MTGVGRRGPDKQLLPPHTRPAPPRTSSAGPIAALQGCGAAWTLPLSAPDHPYAAAFKLLPGLRDYFAGLDHANGSSATPDAIRSPPPPTNPHPYAELFRLQPGLREYFASLTKAEARRPRPGQLGTSASGPKDHPYAEIFRDEPWLPEFLKDVYAVRPASPQGGSRPQAHPFGADPGDEDSESPGIRCALAKLAKVARCIRILRTQGDAWPPADRELAEAQVRVLYDHRLPVGARMGALAFLSEASDREAARGCLAPPTPSRNVFLKGVAPRKDAVGPSPRSPFGATATPAGSCTRGLGAAGDLSTAFSGVCYWRYHVVRPPDEEQPAFDEKRRKQGTPEQLLRDAERLGITHLRQVEDADAYFGSLWVGCADYGAGLFGETNEWIEIPEQAGWACSPSSAEAAGWHPGAPCGTPALPATCPPTVDPAGGCYLPTATDAGGAPPVLVAPLRDLAAVSSVRSLLVLPVLYGRSGRASGGPNKAFDWTYVNQEGSLVAGQTYMLPVSYPYGEEDLLAGEFIRQLFADLTLWGAGGPLPAVQYGNELDGNVPADAVAWLILRTALDLAQCAPPTLQRVFPGLYSPSNECPPEPPPDIPTCPPSPCGGDNLEFYIDKTRRQVEDIFFEISRAIMVLEVHVDPTIDPDLDDRLEALMGTGGVPPRDMWPVCQVLLAFFNIVYGTGGTVPSSPAMLDSCDPLHREVVKVLSRANLRAPFDVMDFHWYACREAETPLSPYVEQAGEFLYLSKAAAYLNGPSGLRALLADWWSDGGGIPLWCSETGIASHASPFLEPDVPANQIAYGYRVDPATVRLRTGSDDPTCWPAWVFTSEREQARQVWMRLSFLAALGVHRALWYANQAETQGAEGDLSRFYSFGLTSDTRADADTDYVLRRRKLGFCALRRWNEYLEHFVSAQVALGLDGTLAGLEGFYAVLFERSPDSVAAATYDTATYPHALLLWADPQAYDWSTFAAACDATTPPPPSQHLSVFFRPSSDMSNVWIVPTVPYTSLRSDGLEALCSPCIDDGAEPVQGVDADDFRGPEVMRFDPPVSLPFAGILPIGVTVDQDPVLILLPEGELFLDLIEGAAAAVPDLVTLRLAKLPLSPLGAG